MTTPTDDAAGSWAGWAARLRTCAQPPLWITLAIAAVILGLRRPDMVHTPQFWAEDGHFYMWAYAGGLHTLFQEYAGYLHTIPRLIALLANAFDPRWAPTIFVSAAAASTLYVVARTQSQRSPLAGNVVTALAVVLIPDAFEVLLTTCNLQSVIAGGLVLLLISADPRRWWQAVHDVLAAVLLGLTGPFSVFLAPLFLVRAGVRRSRSSWILAALVVGCAVIQAWLIVTHPRDNPGEAFKPAYLLAVPGLRVGASLLLGTWTSISIPLLLANLLGAATLAAIVWLCVRPGEHRGVRIAFGVTFGLLLVSSLQRCRLVLPDLCQPGYGSRYFYLPQLLVVWLLLFLAKNPRRALAATAVALLVWMLAVNLPRLREPAFENEHWEQYVPQLRAGEAVTIPTNPVGWSVPFPQKKSN